MERKVGLWSAPVPARQGVRVLSSGAGCFQMPQRWSRGSKETDLLLFLMYFFNCRIEETSLRVQRRNVLGP